MKYNKWLVKGLHRLTQIGQQMAKLYGKTSSRLAVVTAGSTDISQVLAEMEVLDLWYTDGIQKSLVNTLSLKADLVSGIVPANQLPSYVDDVIEASDFAAFPVTGETGKIYYALDTNSSYRWTGSAYYETNSTQEFYLRTSTTNNTSGAITGLDTAQKSFIRFSAATTLHSLLGISVTDLNKLIIITNINSVNLLIKNESGTEITASNRILTGTGLDFNLLPDASALLIYDYSASRWRVASGSGGSGTGLQLTTLKNSNYTADSFELILCDTSLNSFNVTLPSAPTDGDVIGIVDVKGSFSAYPLIITASQDIQGQSDDYQLDINYTYIELFYSQTEDSWFFKEVPSGGAGGFSIVNQPVAGFNPTFVDGDLSAGILTVNHGLNVEFPIVQVYDNNRLQIIPTEIESVDANTVRIDLTGYTPLTGTWRARIL